MCLAYSWLSLGETPHKEKGDTTPEIYAKAKDSGSIWTRHVLAIPSVNVYYVKTPTSTTKGIKIKVIKHKTDFLRIIALQKFGGVYLDTDAVPLRSIDDQSNIGSGDVNLDAADPGLCDVYDVGIWAY
ncbi:hypothetical protein GQ53DRAFT_857744 [Thozetella sp. PMI_491]|nr:hypothetical protein GQ53DRAFT_857744 [Thozetella sp. PMI_491]